MSHVPLVDRESASGAVRDQLDQIHGAFGTVPSMFSAVANSPAALASMWGSFGALGGGALGPEVAEQIAVAVANRNSCEYCLAAHTALGRNAGVTSEALADAQAGISEDPRIEAMLRFALELVEARGQVTAADIDSLRTHGWTDEHIVEAIGHVAPTCSPTTSTSPSPSPSTSPASRSDPHPEHPGGPTPRARSRRPERPRHDDPPNEENTPMRWIRTITLVAVIAIIAIGCGDDDDTTAATPDPTQQQPTSDANADDEADETGHDHDHPAGAVVSDISDSADPAFDLVVTSVTVEGDEVVFRSDVVAAAGSQIPEPVGALDQAPVWSYVWPTTLNSSTIGFDADQGIVALAATSHPDFDDTPLYDEDNDGDAANDGALWHTHWVVLVESTDCGGGLSVRDIPEGETPTVPATWPELPILIDSPDIATHLGAETVEIRVPISDLGSDVDFGFDGVTSGLRVSTSPHDPLLCVEAVFDVASGDLSLPGKVDQ